jgi:hypothetical protein
VDLIRGKALHPCRSPPVARRIIPPPARGIRGPHVISVTKSFILTLLWRPSSLVPQEDQRRVAMDAGGAGASAPDAAPVEGSGLTQTLKERLAEIMADVRARGVRSEFIQRPREVARRRPLWSGYTAVRALSVCR